MISLEHSTETVLEIVRNTNGQTKTVESVQDLMSCPDGAPQLIRGEGNALTISQVEEFREEIEGALAREKENEAQHKMEEQIDEQLEDYVAEWDLELPFPIGPA